MRTAHIWRLGLLQGLAAMIATATVVMVWAPPAGLAQDQGEFSAGIRAARGECLDRQGHFWNTDKGYGCNQTVTKGDFRCKADLCALLQPLAIGTPGRAREKPGSGRTR